MKYDYKKKGLTRSEKSAKTKQRIFQGAMELFEKNGFENVTMKEIASFTQTSIGSIYHFFKDKDSIALYMMAAIDHQYQEYFKELGIMSVSKSMSAMEQLKRFCVRIPLISVSLGDLSLSLIYIHGLKHLEQDNLRMDNRQIYVILEYLINKCKEEGSLDIFCSNEDIKRRIIILARGLLLDWLFSGHAFDIERESDYMMSLLLDEIKKIN